MLFCKSAYKHFYLLKQLCSVTKNRATPLNLRLRLGWKMHQNDGSGSKLLGEILDNSIEHIVTQASKIATTIDEVC